MPLTFHKKPALVAYVTCGDPDLVTTKEIILAAISAGADVVELGVPFSDPVADGPTPRVRGDPMTDGAIALTPREVHPQPADPTQDGLDERPRRRHLGIGNVSASRKG